ncbi:Vitamin B6 biosynthesis protein [Mycena venus]|uniref:Vitamin B6 biosynthesis protein n=1 Tax=Mycena venus TaxID=2733690 RepID=A0A8H6XDX6_9AGAR|nr:Vitamin B6 biosynthesis protein [Mycena venus]
MTTPAAPATAANPANGVAPTRSAQREGGGSSLGTFGVKSGLAQMLKGGKRARACAVMALERVPADIRADGGVARMSDPSMIKEIIAAVTIPVMAKVRIGHFVEAQILQAIGVDYIDESEVLTPADDEHHINKHNFKVPFVCGARNLGEALRRISEGAAFIRTKGEAGTGNVVEAVRHERAVNMEIRKASIMTEDELYLYAKEIQGQPARRARDCLKLMHTRSPVSPTQGDRAPETPPPSSTLLRGVSRLPVSDAAMMMQLGCDGVFVGSGIFKAGDAAKRARAIVQAVTHYNNPKILAEVSENLGPAMVGLTIDDKLQGGRLADRGW